jgi:hypothetical protein
LTAITGDPCFANTFVASDPGLESIVIAAFERFTRRFASFVTDPSAYLAAAATGK